jgi:Transcriptional regulators
MREVAKAAKVHVTTVSLALRNSPQLPEATRQRIQALAKKLGYRTNPLVAAFVQQRRISHPTKYQGLLGFITHSTESVRTLPDNVYIVEMFRAAEAHAREVGFRLEPFEARDYGLNAARLERALHARGVRGLILPPTEDRDGEIVQLNWDHFSCVTLSTSIHRPLMDRVVTDHFGGARMAVRTAWERGYRRPGYFSLASTDERTQGRWRGGFLAEAQSLGLEKKVPVLVAEDVGMREAFRRWYLRWKPDVLISIGLTFDTCLPVLEELGVSSPENVGLIELNLHTRRGEFSGVDPSVSAMSRIGVDMLVSKLYRNESGLSRHPQVSMHPPVWHEGRTLPARVPA